MSTSTIAPASSIASGTRELRIDAARLMSRLSALAEIGPIDGGVRIGSIRHAPTASEPHRIARIPTCREDAGEGHDDRDQ